MKKKVALLCAGMLVAFGCLFIMGCTTGSGSSNTEAEKAVTVDLKNGGVAESKDATLTVTLDENGTTGYTWVYEIDDEGVLTFVKDETIAGETDDGRVGVGGTRIFEFKGKDAGTTEVSFILGQHWDGGETSDDDAFTLEVTVDDNGQITKLVEK